MGTLINPSMAALSDDEGSVTSKEEDPASEPAASAEHISITIAEPGLGGSGEEREVAWGSEQTVTESDRTNPRIALQGPCRPSDVNITNCSMFDESHCEKSYAVWEHVNDQGGHTSGTAFSFLRSVLGSNGHESAGQLWKALKYVVRTLDLFPYDDERSPIRAHIRQGYIVSILLSLVAVMLLISTTIASFVTFRRNDLITSDVLGVSAWDLDAPLNQNTTGFFGAYVTYKAKPYYNTSVLRVRYYERTIYDGNYKRGEPCQSDFECRNPGNSHSRATCDAGKCNPRSPFRDLGAMETPLPGQSRVLTKPLLPTSIHGGFGDPEYKFIYTRVEMCQFYCATADGNGLTGGLTHASIDPTIPCSSCASMDEMEQMTQAGAFGISLNAIDSTTYATSSAEKVHVTSGSLSTMTQLESYFRSTRSELKDKWWTGIWPGDFSTIAWSSSYFRDYSRSSPTEHSIVILYLRADRLYLSVTATPVMTLAGILQSVGATWTIICLTIGFLGKAANSLASSKMETEKILNSYIRAVAWSSIPQANYMAWQLKRGKLTDSPCETKERELQHKMMFETVHHFRKYIEAASGVAKVGCLSPASIDKQVAKGLSMDAGTPRSQAQTTNIHPTVLEIL